MERFFSLLTITLVICCMLATCSICASASQVKQLNNLVVELVNVTGLGGVGRSNFNYTNPYDGWIFFSVKYPNGKTLESMKFMAKGDHTFTAQQKPDAVIIRAIPELIYCQYPVDSLIKGYGSYNWEFLNKYISKNANCMTVGGISDSSDFKDWKAQGKRIVVHGGVPGSSVNSTVELSNTYSAWYNHPGFQNDLADGMIVDEFVFGPNDDRYGAWSDALNKIFADKKMKDKVFYAWAAGDPMYNGEKGLGFLKTIYAHGGKVAVEYYISESKTLDEADKSFNAIRNDVGGWKNANQQGNRNVIATLGYMSQPNESLNTDPKVDFKVFMDKMMYVVANDPSLDKLYGIIWYLTPYTDEETVRWGSELFRHYCIEGKKDMLSDKYGFKYVLDHVGNPDFDKGTQGWNIAEAEKGSISTTTQDGWSWLQGRYPPTSMGNTCLVTKRSAIKPNTITQEIKNLVPGKLYSMKMMSGDRLALANEISDQTPIKMSINIDNVDMLTSKGFDETTSSCYSHIWGKFNSAYKFWFTYHWRVFKAKGNTAKLTITDWSSDKDPGGPIGQELMHNFVEIQPYFSE